MKISFNFESKTFDRNQSEELLQRIAWKLVRSAADRFGDNKGEKKLSWCIFQLQKEFSAMNADSAEDYIRAAYQNFKTETKYAVA